MFQADHFKIKLLNQLASCIANLINFNIDLFIHHGLNSADWMWLTMTELCFCRNHFMQLVFGAIVLLGNATLAMDVLPVLTIFEPDGNHILWPIIFLFINLGFYQLSCTTNPGEITKDNVDSYLAVYKADNLLYKPGAQCQTCKIVKPARSKHCSKCW